MESSGWIGPRFGLALLGAGILVSFAPQPAAAQNTVGASRPADEVARNLRALAANPRSVAALMGAGKASLAVGDAQAALSFFSRAEEQLPNDGRIKMWIGSALVQLEQPRPALKFFDEARRLGVAEADLAGDRGLVHDMLGDPRGAQRDYELALRTAANPEITRRLALSYGISGDRERALRLLEEQLLVRDPAAERTRALVLALTGDTAGAVRLTQAAMPGPASDAMAPFLTRLPSLSPAERAMAVHFGRFPGEGGPSPAASAYASLEPATSAGAPDPRQPALGAGRPAAPTTDTRRRPDAAPIASTTLASTHAPPVAVGGPAAQPPIQRRFEPPASQPAASPPPIVVAAREPEPQPPAAEPAPSETEAESNRLADLAAALAAIEEEAPPPAPPARTRAAATPTKPTARQAAAAESAQRQRASAAAAKKPPAPPRETARVWVQVAGGANKSWLPREYARLKAKAPKLLGSRTAWTVPVSATNRLLVGPFASNREAQAFVNELARMGVSGFAWTSAAGQKVDRLAAR
ncbi:MAG TPA: SPOR domain-containing protein [Allosphingosinicella sp.]|nr:SPOR domain-containing protein [Allosphingosinicella sp.]